ncbi:MAG: carbonic anhydrase [Pyrinomonadaceae bacterium]
MHSLSIFFPIIKRSFLFLAALIFAAYASSLALGSDGPEVTAEAALERLQRGNQRFALGKLEARDYPHERHDLVKGQHPYAIVLACSDSRVPPEIVFDESLGKLFIVRVASHVADPVVLGSIEYAVEHLHAHLLVVLGHEGCGAVKATLAGGEVPRNISSLVTRISPAAEKARGWKLGEAALFKAAITENVRYQMQMALYESDVLTHQVHDNKLKIVGGVYNLDSGLVEMIPSSMVVAAPIEKAAPAPAAVHARADGVAHGANEEHAPAAHQSIPVHAPAREVPAPQPTVLKHAAPKHTAPRPAAPKPAAPKPAAPKPAHTTPHHAQAIDADAAEEIVESRPAASHSLAELIKGAYEKKFDVVLQKSSRLHDADDRCASFNCRNIPAGEVVTIDNPLILQLGDKPQIRIKYKGNLGYIFAQESDLAFMVRDK